MRTKEKKLPLILYSFISIFFIEFVFRAITVEKVFSISLIYILFSSALYSLIITFLSKFLNPKGNKIIYYILLFIICFWAAAEMVYKNTFNVYLSLAMLKLADQAMAFWKDALTMIGRNIIYLIILFIPFIGGLVFKKKINFNKKTLKSQGIFLAIIVISILVFRGILLINKNSSYSAYKLYYEINDTALSIEKFGYIESTYLDIKKSITNFQEKIIFIDQEEKEEEPKEIVYDYNIDKNIDFESLINSTSNKTLKQMHEYFNSDSGTKQNEYTGYFKDKNLILFMAESFNEIAVDEKYTPTLYKLVNNGFVFNNFYTPVNNSTIGGEFQEVTGLFANNSILKTWRNGKNSYPYGLGFMFQDAGYKTFAYHDHYHTFQDRNKYLNAIGFTNFEGCYNGIEKKMTCYSKKTPVWPESDVEMIEGTFNDYINEDKFMVFYASVSGHGDYTLNGNSMSKKHKDEVADMNVSEKPKAYIAAQIEFNNALELLINKLEEAGKLDDTVIAFVGDHYPYMLSLDEVNELSDYKKDNVIEINRSNFVLWNNKMDPIQIDKVGSEIDVLPTIYNIFALPYDSRVIIGKDILSTEPGLAIMNNRSWVSDKGKYFANTKSFVPNAGVEVSEDYVSNMNSIVSSKITMSKNIISENYYKYLK